MIVPYVGMFLANPVPLELSLDSCSYMCGYCFSSLNGYTRKTSAKSIVNLIKDRHDRDTLTARLLSEGYPVCLSNRTDPFCERNRDEAIQLIRLMVNSEIPIAFQTKGGDIGDILDYLPPSCWYITIEFDDDEKMKAICPNAPDLQSRWELIDRLKKKGHSVVIGLNPTVSGWLNEPEKFFDRAYNAGVHGIFLNYLHIQYVQQRRLKPDHKEFIGERELTRAGSKLSQDDFENIMGYDIVRMIRSKKLSPFMLQMYEPSDFFDPYYKLYPKVFPVLQNLLNTCAKNNWDRRVISFETALKSMGGSLLPGSFGMESYIASRARQVFRTNEIPKKMTYKQLISFIWNEHRIPSSPTNNRAFNWITDGEYEIQDNNGINLLCYRHGGYRGSKYIHKDEINDGRG